MAVISVSEPRTKMGGRDNEGYREFTVSHIVETNDILDGPYVVMNAGGLPAIGSIWNFGNDVDIWAFCTPYMQVRVHEEKEGDSTKFWRAEQKFSTKPLNRCQDTTIEDPLLEPQKVSGSFVNYTKEAVFDKDGNMIRNSAWEQLRGSIVEFDEHRATVKIGQNVATLGLDVFTAMMNTVNDSSLWGLSARMIKLSNVSWERQYYGVCNIYYTRTFDFDIDFNTFDRTALDEGKKVLRGHWKQTAGESTPGTSDDVYDYVPDDDADPNNPKDFVQAEDRFGNPIHVILDGSGDMWDGTGSPGSVSIQKYAESNFLLLDIPILL